MQQCNPAGTRFVDVTDDLACDGATRLSCNGAALVSNACTDAERCAASTGATCAQCVNDTQCRDASFCNGAETCDTATHSCQPGSSAGPSDGNFCNGPESCDEAGDACVSAGNPCAAALVCSDLRSECVECVSVEQCSPGFVCNGDNVCVPDAGEGGI